MAEVFDNYTRLTDASHALEPCAVCGSGAELWQFQATKDGPASKVVCCSLREPFGPQDGIVNEGCLLYMPPDGFYKATIREAVRYWNEYQKTLARERRKRDWQRCSVLREAAGGGEG